MIAGFSQYKNDFFNKLDFEFKKGKKILDVGCGEGTDAEVFTKAYNLDFYGVDVYKSKRVDDLSLNFKIGNIYRIPFKDNTFDYVFSHDVIHHIDEKQKKENFLKAFAQLRRVCKKDGYIFVIEGNRFNPLFYPHMVKMRKHEHLKQSAFQKLIKEAFIKDEIKFKFFEAHLYPRIFLPLFKVYESIMENFSPRRFLAYNAAIIKKS